MAGAAHVRCAAALEGLIGADLVALVVVRAAGRLDQFAEFVVEAFVPEVALLLGDPFLQPEVRLDDEFVLGHWRSPLLLVPFRLFVGKAQQQSCCPSRLSRCSATRRAPIILTWSSINRRAPAASRISISDANSLWASRMRRATVGVRVGFCAGQETCCSEINCTTRTRLCEASATAR